MVEQAHKTVPGLVHVVYIFLNLFLLRCYQQIVLELEERTCSCQTSLRSQLYMETLASKNNVGALSREVLHMQGMGESLSLLNV